MPGCTVIINLFRNVIPHITLRGTRILYKATNINIHTLRPKTTICETHKDILPGGNRTRYSRCAHKFYVHIPIHTTIRLRTNGCSVRESNPLRDAITCGSHKHRCVRELNPFHVATTCGSQEELLRAGIEPATQQCLKK